MNRKPQGRERTSRRSKLKELMGRKPSWLATAEPSTVDAGIYAVMNAAVASAADERTSSISHASAAERKAVPMVAGLLDYFPDALAAVAHVSKIGNDQHNPGQPLHWARGKSTDEADCIVRHLVDRGKFDIDPTNPNGPKVRHSAKLAWRALALLQKEIEESEGLPISRGSWEPGR